MGLNDRDYWREVPEYLRLTGRGGRGDDDSHPPRPSPAAAPQPPKRAGSSAAVRPGFLWAFFIVAVLVLGLGLLAYLHPVKGTASSPTLVPRLAPTSPAAGSRTPRHHVEPITGTRLLTHGGTLTLSGKAVPMSGSVRVLGRWNGGAWETFAIADANGRSYRFVFPLDQRGTLNLRVVQPNGDEAVATYHVS